MPRPRALSSDRPFLSDRPGDWRLVKSAERVIQILELFDDLKSSATVADVAERINIPQSSTSALLHSLHELGYLSYDPDRRVYAATNRVALLGSWIDPLVVREGPLLGCVREISERTGLHAFLSARNRLYAQIVYSQYGTDPGAYYARGSCRFLTAASSGLALLSRLPDAEIGRIVTATNARLGPDEVPFNRAELMSRIGAIRRDGYAVGVPARSRDYVTVATPLPPVAAEPMALGLAVDPVAAERGPGHFADLVKDAIARWLPSSRA
jgi:DNA-binding IclR family transcriptional regulator